MGGARPPQHATHFPAASRRAASDHRFRRGGAAPARGRRRELRGAAGRNAGTGRRVRLRQVDDRVLDPAAGPAAGPNRRRARALQRPQSADAAGTRDARGSRRRRLPDLPGADDRAQPGVHRRRSDRRGDASSTAWRRRPGPAPGRRTPRGGAGARARPPRHAIPASALRRHAPAGHDRHGPRVPPVARHRRRADHRPRRDDPGPDPRSARARCAPRSSCRWC